MGIFHCDSRVGKRLAKKSKKQGEPIVRLTALLLCLSLLAGFFPALVQAEDGAREYLFDKVTFGSITLHDADSNEKIESGALIEKGKKVTLRYTYTITENQCKDIEAGKNYYLKVSPHLVLPHLESGSPLTLQGETTPFGYIHADGSEAWVEFLANKDTGELLLGSDGLLNADFYLECTRAADVPAGEDPIEGHSNLYAMTVEEKEILQFGYAEHEPVMAQAEITKGGSLSEKTITWTIDYTPWQNPGEGDTVALDTPFELRDTIQTDLHEYVKDSAAITIGGTAVTVTPYTSGGTINRDVDAYVIVDMPADGGDTTLTFGGKIFNAVESTRGNPAVQLKITYQTAIKDELLLPGSAGGGKVTNAAALFAGKDGVFNSLNIAGKAAVTVNSPAWVTKSGETTREPGNGSTTDWTVTFAPNGFTFGEDEALTLHDQLPPGSSLVGDSVEVTVNSVKEMKTVTKNEADNSFTVSGIETANKPVTITYQTHVPEVMYDSGTSLGNNVAWFTFDYNGSPYSTPKATTPVGSGDGSGTPGTATLVKENGGYKAASRTIDWTVTINPHKANLRSGTFTDDLSQIGPAACGREDHGRGLEVVGGRAGIQVLVGGSAPVDESTVKVEYSNQKITVTAENVGANMITLTYTTKVCDPCVFANNTGKTEFKNTISTGDMVIGTSDTGRSASAESIANVSAAVLTKKPPVYDYASGTMKWTVEVDAAGLPMADVVLTDELPGGLAYVDGSLKTAPEIQTAAARTAGQTLVIDLGTVTGKTTVTFDTKVDPEEFGFSSNEAAVVENTIFMDGKADGLKFATVSHKVMQNFSNHGLVKSSAVKDREELIEYKVLINPYHLKLSENPSLVDTLDERLQLDADTLKLYKVTLNGTTESTGKTPPSYTIAEEITQPPKITDFDPAANSYTVQLPIGKDSTDAFLLTYTADIMNYQKGSYSNKVHFKSSAVLLGGEKTNGASTSGGGGGGGGGVAARKATISIVKTDSETKEPLSGVSFLLYQWDGNTRGLPFAQGMTDAQGRLSFRVKPEAVYELVETHGAPGYGSAMGWTSLPVGVEAVDGRLLITAGEKGKTLTLNLTNEAHTADIVFRLVNASGVPMAGVKVQLFREDPTGKPDPAPDQEAAVSADGTVKFSSVRRGRTCFIRYPDNQIMTVTVPVDESKQPMATLPGGMTVPLTAAYKVPGDMAGDQQWGLTVKKVVTGGDTPLPGAEIGLFADEACRTLIKSGVSGEEGTVAFEGLIKNQKYWVKEITAPGGYQLNDTAYEGTETTPSPVTIENAPSPVSHDRPEKPNVPVEPDLPIDPDTPPIDPDTPPIDPDTPPIDPAEPENPEELPTELPDPNAPSAPELITIMEDGVPKTYRKVWDLKAETWVYILDGDVPLDYVNVPQTGDYTQLLIAGTLLSGILLAAMTLYRFSERKKRER